MINRQPDNPPRRHLLPSTGIPVQFWTNIPVAAIAAALLAVAGCSALPGSTSAPAAAPGSTAQPTAQPKTEAGVRDAATRFYALYAASQWAPAWQMLAPTSQAAAPESVYVAVHESCPSASAGMSRVIKSVVMAGSTAVVTETVSGLASTLGSTADAWTYSSGRWGIDLPPDGIKDYSHGSAAADVTAMKQAGECGAPQPLPTMPTMPVATQAAAPTPSFQTLATIPAAAPPPPPTFAPLPAAS